MTDMTSTRDLTEILHAHLAAAADPTVLDGQVESVVAATAGRRQRPAWLASLRSHSMTTTTRTFGRPLSSAAWTAILILTLLLALAVGAITIGGWRPMPSVPVTQSAASPTLPPVVGPKDDTLPLAGSDLTLALLIPPVMFADGECFVRDDLLAYVNTPAPTTVEEVQLLSLIDCNYQNGPLMRASYALAPDDAALAAMFGRWGLEDVPDGVDCRSHIPGRADYVDGGRTGTLKCWEEDNLATVRSIEFASSQRESRTLFAISARPSTSLHELVTAWEAGRP